MLELDQNNPGVQVIKQDLNKAAISLVNVQPFIQDGYFYGSDQEGMLYGTELASGKRRWSS
ncbi:MAG: hypothetical protein OSA98_12445 [Rubripirellula sp.]|nr:hypothetical protein [Rubripirellula sp.]